MEVEDRDLSLPRRVGRAIKEQRRIIAIIATFVVLISSMVGYNAFALARESRTPLVIDITSRQRSYVERYMKDVLLKLDGIEADPDETRRVMEMSADALLLRGGLAPAPEGSIDELVRVPPPATDAIRTKLANERRLIRQLVDNGNTLRFVGKSSPSYVPTLFLMRLTAAQLSSVTSDAAGEEARAAHDSLVGLVRVEIVLGLLGALAAVGMGLLLWRSAEKQSARFRSLVHNSLDLITVVDENSIALYQSPSSTRVLGYARDVIGTKLTDLLHPSDKSRVISAFAEIYDRPGETAALTFRMRHIDGSWATMEGTVLNLVSDATVGGFVVNTRDVTERELVAAELASARDAALEASRMKSQFLASMSHEIRTPMNAVIGLTELLVDSPLTDEQRRYASGVQSAADGLLSIINDILDFSKVEAGKLNVEVVDLDLGVLLEDVVALCAETAQAKSLELLVHPHLGLPTALRGDPTRLRQVLVNLVSNAVKFTSEGEVVLAASLVSETSTVATVRFEVCDTGIGIAPDDQVRMFDPFSQADSSTTRRFGGTGLGLAIVKQLVELMGGHLGLESEVDVGSRFWFELPLDKQDVDHTAVEPQIQNLGSLRVLVVDDNATNRLILHQQLASWGMEPDEEPDAMSALARMRAAATNRRAYDIVVLDLNMPEMDGLELARRIAAEPEIADAKMFLLSSSGKVSDQVATEFRLSGALSKPVRQSELFNCLATGLGVTGGKVVPAKVAPREAVERHGHILLVEDNAMNQLVATKIVEKLGYTVDVAENGHEALAAIAAGSYAAVLMDCQMPEMDGYEATRQLRKLEREGGPRLAVIAMTAAAMEGDRERCLAAGMDDYITKPVRSAAVDAVLTKWIAGIDAGVAIDEPAAAVENDFPLDPERLATLRELDGGDGELLNAVVTEFVGDSTRQLIDVSAALRQGDPQLVERTVHSLRGASANLGATTLADLCGELEALARAAALAMAPDLLDSIRAKHVRVCSALDVVFTEI